MSPLCTKPALGPHFIQSKSHNLTRIRAAFCDPPFGCISPPMVSCPLSFSPYESVSFLFFKHSGATLSLGPLPQLLLLSGAVSYQVFGQLTFSPLPSLCLTVPFSSRFS